MTSLPYCCKRLEDGRLAFYIDNHLINTFNTCERLFELRHIHHLRPKGMSKALSLGSWWSLALEKFYARFQGEPAVPTAVSMVECAGEAWNELKMDELAIYRPKDFVQFGGRDGAVLMATQYYTIYGLSDFQNWKIIAAERGFGLKGELVLHEDKEIVIYYVGKPDLVIFDNRGQYLAPADHKTVERIDAQVHKKFNPYPQLVGYIWAVNLLAEQLKLDRKVDRCVVNIAARALPSEKPRDGVKKPRFMRIYPNFSPDQVEEWRQNVIEKTRRLKYCIEKNVWLWKESSCHLYGGCAFRGIDSLTPSQRDLAIKSDFVQVEPWVPYEVGEPDEVAE